VRKAILLLIIVTATGCLWLVVLSASHKIIVRTYFRNAPGLLSGARVRVDGMELGFVREISLEPQHRDRPIAVRMALDTEHGLIIPSDAAATLETEGMLGPTFVEIDTRNKTGAPIGNNAILESTEPADNAGAHALEVVGKSFLESRKLREKDKPPLDPAKLSK
jgi:ABC-type transporter Mla subunit MlaD